MARINLRARDGAEERILEYLEVNASEALAAKINAGRKTLAAALKYCEGEARKLNGGAGCVAVCDATVFGWAVHYFEEREAEDGGRKAEDGGRKAENGGRKSEGGERRTEGGGREAEDGGRKADDGGRKADDGGRKAEDGGREAEDGDVESVEAGDNPFEGAAIFGGVK